MFPSHDQGGVVKVDQELVLLLTWVIVEVQAVEVITADLIQKQQEQEIHHQLVPLKVIQVDQLLVQVILQVLMAVQVAVEQVQQGLVVIQDHKDMQVV